MGGIGLSCVSPFVFKPQKSLRERAHSVSGMRPLSPFFFGFYTLLLFSFGFSATSFVRRLFLQNDFLVLFPCFCKGLLLCHSLFFYNFFYFYRFFFQVFIFIFTAFYSLFLILLKYFLFYFLINFIDFYVIFYIFSFSSGFFVYFSFSMVGTIFFIVFIFCMGFSFFVIFRHFYILHAVLFFRFTLGCSQSVDRAIQLTYNKQCDIGIRHRRARVV